MAVWEHNRLVVISLSTLVAGQFLTSVVAMMGVKAAYLDDVSGCVPISVDARLGAVMYTEAMTVDFAIMLLIVYKTYLEYKTMYHSGLIKLIFRDGLAYFAVA